jgi:uncharacterized protein YdeI (YjbR/CyaY-like superfamily)
MQEIYFKNRNQWRNWLEKNHNQCDEGIWIVYFKKHTKKPSISYDEAVEEALCFGWIDSKINRIDEERYRQIFIPRRKKSIWSLLNKKRAQKLIKEGKMTEAGLKEIKKAKKQGTWQKAYTSQTKPTMPEELKKALKQNTVALDNFNNFTNSMQLRYIYWINDAKREETRQKRIKQVVQLATQNIKPSMT